MKKNNLHKKTKFSSKNLLSKCDHIRNFLKIWSHLLMKPLMENFIFSAVLGVAFAPYKICDEFQRIKFPVSFWTQVRIIVKNKGVLWHFYLVTGNWKLNVIILVYTHIDYGKISYD